MGNESTMKNQEDKNLQQPGIVAGSSRIAGIGWEQVIA